MKFYVGFSRPKAWKPYAKLIMWAYGIDYDHVYVKFNTWKGMPWIFQAAQLSVNIMGEEFYTANIVVHEFEIELDSEQVDELRLFMWANLGKPYGILQAIGLAVIRVGQFVGLKVSNPFANKGETYVCSTLVTQILKKIDGMKIPDKTDNVNPRELFQYLSQLPSVQKIK